MTVLRSFWVWLACCAAGSAVAQNTTLEPSSALQCLTRGAAAAPTYPPDLLERKDGTTIEVELTFNAPDAAPKVKVLGDQARDDRFEDAVRAHVRAFRVPCLRPDDRSVVLRQVYVFTPNDGRKVVSSEPVDERSKAHWAKLDCMSHVLKMKQPDYPDDARRADSQGAVLVHLRFTKPDAPPEVRVLAAADKFLRREVEAYTAGLRLPCLDGDEISINRTFLFEIVGGGRTVFKDTTLQQLLASARNLATPVYFDFGSMGCPFDVRLTYNQPYLPNGVGELLTANPARKPFLDWLTRLTLNLDEKTNLRVVGQQMNISVPCGSLDL